MLILTHNSNSLQIEAFCSIDKNNYHVLKTAMIKIRIHSEPFTIGVGVRMSTLDSNVAGSIPASICFLLEQGTLSALLQSTQL